MKTIFLICGLLALALLALNVEFIGAAVFVVVMASIAAGVVAMIICPLFIMARDICRAVSKAVSRG